LIFLHPPALDEAVSEVIFTAENAEHAEKNIIILRSLCDLSVLCGEKKA
jgi:hypothetical protein